MLSQDDSIAEAIECISELEFILENYKAKINSFEVERISDLMKDLKTDEDRLNICIENIELLHRNMFVLPNTNSKPFNTDNDSSVKDIEYSVIVPEPSENESVCIMNASEPYEDQLSFMQQPDCSMNVPECLREDEPDCLIQLPNRWVHEPDCLMNVPDLREDEPDLLIQQPNCSIHEQDNSRERLIMKIPKSLLRIQPSNQSNYSKYETANFSDESGNGSDESTEYEPSNVEKEYSKQTVLNKLADKEKEISESVLKLIFEFSCFQRKLRAVEKNVPVSTRHFASGSNVKLKENLEALSETVLKLDKDVNKINKKYSKCINKVMNDKVTNPKNNEQ